MVTVCRGLSVTYKKLRHNRFALEVSSWIKIVSLVDEQDAAHGFLEDFLRLGRGMADILADQIIARHRNEMAAPHKAELVQNIGHAQRDRGLARAAEAPNR